MSVKSFKTSGVGVDLAPKGLVLINTTSFSGVSSQSINDVFSATYTNYFISLETDASDADQGLNMRLRVSGSDNSSNNYRWSNGYVVTDGAASVSAQNSNGLGNAFRVAAISSVARNFAKFDLFNPFTAEETGFLGQFFQKYGANSTTHFSGGIMSVTTSYTGFTLIPGAGTITGTVSVYGYNK
jgi:hypothetical protein